MARQRLNLPSLMRHRVTLQTAAETPDGGGGFTTSWTDTATLWARIEPLSGRERMAAQQLESPVSHKITIRHDSTLNVTAKMRVKFKTRFFNVRSVIRPEEVDHVLVLMAEEGVAT